MAQIRALQEHEAEQVRDLWSQMCIEVGTLLKDTDATRIAANLREYAKHQQVHCFVAEEQQRLIGFVTCSVTGHPVMPGLAGEIEELYVQSHPQRHELRTKLVRQAVHFMLERGASSVHTHICTGKDCQEEVELRTFWSSLGWDNDMTIFSIYSDVPGDPTLQHVWNEYRQQAV